MISRVSTLYRCVRVMFAAAFCLLSINIQSLGQNLATDLVSYWPLDELQGTKTPDLVSGYDMDVANLSAADLVVGKVGKAFSFSNSKQTLLSRVHAPGEQLPINQHPSFTVAFWAKVNGTGQNDLRLFSEGNTGSSDPLFNIGTHSGGADGSVDLFIRQSGWPTVNHIRTTAQPFDDTWHHVVFVQENGVRSIYVDGELDELEIVDKPEGTFNVNNTSIGGILRASPSFWVTGLIDDVAVWKRALTPAEINTLEADGLKSVFSPLATGLVSHWPLNEVQGTKTPDIVSGYDMDVSNLTAADLIDGKVGKAFSFSNSKQTLLSRVHAPGEQLPINQHPSFSVAFWAKVNGAGQNDLRLFSEGNTGSSDPLFNIGTHSGGADGSVDLFIRQSGWPTVNHIRTTAQPFDDTWHHVVFVQENGVRSIYVDGQLDELEIPDKPEGTFNVNNTSIGGILRASPSFWVTGLIDEVAVWKRPLTQPEIAEVIAGGVPTVTTRKTPLEIRSFTTEFPTVVQGDKVLLKWEASKDATLTIDNGIGDVAAQTTFGVGSTEVTVNAPTTYTLTATRGGESVTAQARVATVTGVAPGWRLVENFNSLAPGSVGDQGEWKNPEGVFGVVDLGINKVLGYQGGDDLAALPLGSLALKEGQKGTLFFRMYVTPDDPVSNIGINFGLTERPIRFNGDFGANTGPFIRVERLFEGSTIDVLAHNGVAAPFDYSPEPLEEGAVYKVWIDVDNRPFDVQDGVQLGGDVYSVHIQKEGAPSRTTVFQDYISDRDAVNIDPALGAPLPDLTYLFFSAIDGNLGTNTFLVDDFYLSSSGINSTTPIPPSSFIQVDVPAEIRIVSFNYNLGSKTFTLAWQSQSGRSYTVQKKSSLSDASWTTLASGHPAGGATGDTTTFTDTNASENAAFYRITFTP